MTAKESPRKRTESRELTKFEVPRCFVQVERLGIVGTAMTDYAASQGQSPVNAFAPSPGNHAADQVSSSRKSVSADSFRKLTALLKKPNISTVELPSQEPKTVAPVNIQIAPIEIIPVAPVEIVAPTPIPEPVAMAQVPIEPFEVQIAPAQIELPVPEIVSAPAVVVEAPIAPIPEIPKNPVVRQKLRDAFAITPGLVPQRQPIPPIQQTPEQVQEAAELARSLLDMMAAGNSAGLPQERAFAADTLLRMLPRLPVKSLIMLAERVRMMDAPPHLLMAKLIADPNIVVAGPLLEDCMHITDEDLIMVIGDGDFAKIRMIARRRRLTRAITNELVKTGDDSVLLTLVRNLGAEIPQESYLALSEYAKEYPDLLAPLCTRPDLPVPFAFEMFWLAPVQLRRYLLSRFLTDSETLTKILKITRVSDGDEQAENQFAPVEKIIAALDLAGEGDLDGAATALGEFANINPTTAARILGDTKGEPLAALLKAAGVARGQVTEIFEKLQKSSSGLIDPARIIEELQSTFDSLSFNKARILLTYWDWATLKTGPYAPLN